MTIICYSPYPDCNIGIEIIEINCSIFRCGIYKNNGNQINPHLSKEDCDKIKKDEIWGCGRPFQLKQYQGNYQLFQCDYL